RATSDFPEVARVGREIVEKYGQRFPQSHTWARAMAEHLAHAAVASASSAFNEGHLAECDAQLQFALGTWPRIRFTGRWWRIMAKRRLGGTLWNHLRPTVHRLRRL